MSRKKITYKPLPEKKIIRMYVQEKFSVPEIHKRLGYKRKIHPATIGRMLKRSGIKLRNIGFYNTGVSLEEKVGKKRAKEIIEQMRKGMLGKPAWSKGLTKKTSQGVRSMAEKMRGENNPAYWRKGKTYKQIWGDRAEELKKKDSVAIKGKNYVQRYGKKIAKRLLNLRHISQTKNWENPQFREAMKKGLMIKPNLKEKALIKLFKYNKLNIIS